MKRLQCSIYGLVAGADALVMVSSANAQTVQQMAKVVRIKGNARMTTGNDVWQPLKLGALVGAGTLIQTAKDSYVDLVLGDSDAPVASGGIAGGRVSHQAHAEQNTVRIKSDSALAIDKLSATQTGADVVTETQLDLQR